MATWNELRLFLAELVIKPKTIGAFQQKSTAISKNNGMNDNIPYQYNKPQIKVGFRL
jgi:hypothetical protein